LNSPAAQPQLPIRDPRHRPTVGIEGAKHLVDVSEDELLALIEDGRVSHAWHIGLGSLHREVRILRRSLDNYLARLDGAKVTDPTDFEALTLLLPPGHTKPFLTGTDIQRALNCVSTHVINLIEARALVLQPGTSWTTGPAGSPLVTVSSFAQFLKTRRLA
jgi:hypothetical protein